jgi:hypothetical protein
VILLFEFLPRDIHFSQISQQQIARPALIFTGIFSLQQPPKFRIIFELKKDSQQIDSADLLLNVMGFQLSDQFIEQSFLIPINNILQQLKIIFAPGVFVQTKQKRLESQFAFPLRVEDVGQSMMIETVLRLLIEDSPTVLFDFSRLVVG